MRPGRHVQSLADSSFDAWIKFYRRDENTPNAVVSYYAKGALVALALDLTLRNAGASLDGLMRVLWQRHGETGTGVPEDGVETVAIELAGANLSDFFARYVHGTEDPPLASLLGGFGVLLNLRPADGHADRGGKPSRDATDDGPPAGWIGASLTGGAEATLQHVFPDGPAERAGLAAGDIVVAIEGLRASVEAIEKLLRRRRVGETLAVHAFRRDELIAAALTLASAPDDTCWLSVDAAADDPTRARRAAWLGSDT